MRPVFSRLRRLLVAAVALAVALVAESPALRAQIHAFPQEPGAAPEAIAPIYFPHTKSYFALLTDLPKPPQWITAERVARSKTFKGVRGRLAVVRDVETHSFLQANFTIHEEAWIGLRFFCSVRKLVWVDGEEQTPKDFKMWAKPWHRGDSTCTTARGMPYMPIHYLPQSKGFRWQASGVSKYFVSYFIEYPTGKE